MSSAKCLVIEKTGHRYFCRFQPGNEQSALRELAAWALHPGLNLGVNELVEAALKINTVLSSEVSHDTPGA